MKKRITILGSTGSIGTTALMVIDYKKKLFEVDFNTIVELPKGINRNVKHIYEILGNLQKEIYIGEWTIMTIEKAMQVYNKYKNNGSILSKKTPNISSDPKTLEIL